MPITVNAAPNASRTCRNEPRALTGASQSSKLAKTQVFSRRRCRASLYRSAGRRLLGMDHKNSKLAEIDDARRMQLLIDAIVDYAIFMLDVDGTIVSWNSGALGRR
jgi:hypothetical protein